MTFLSIKLYIKPIIKDTEIKAAAAKQVTVSIAHTTADYEIAKQAFENGVSHVTHMWNAMPAYDDIAYAKNIGWLNGYSDGSFRGDDKITRAEVVTVVNRATLRTADKEFVKDNFTKLNRFTDVTDSSKWYFFEVNEAANTHKTAAFSKTETWVK